MYPLKFIPNLHEKIWGGNKLEKVFHKDPKNLANIGESWELSTHPTSPSIVANGYLKGKNLTQLVAEYKEKLVGKKVYAEHQDNFPLLFKFIDANDDLSIQVHPNDEQAMERHNSFGKTEMWYILDAEPNAEITVGFKKDSSKEEYLQALNNGQVETLLKKVPVKAGDTFFIHAGMVHAIGKGVLVAEIQESSDITYRIYDYKRTDANGNERELHTEQALDVINFSVSDKSKIQYTTQANKSTTLVNCEYFQTNILPLCEAIEIDNSTGDSFMVYMCLEGVADIVSGDEIVHVEKGETIMLPASLDTFSIVPRTKETLFLEVRK